MRYYVLLLLVACATYSVANATAAAVVRLLWPLGRPWTLMLPPTRRAQTLAILRFTPVAIALVCAALVGAVFIRFEPRDTTELAGWTLLAAAALSLVLAAGAARRLWYSLVSNAHCAHLVRRCGRPSTRADGLPVWIIDTAYPIAAVAGVFQARLLISARVVAECTDGEMDAIIRHEAAHLRRHDNLLRAAMRCLPDILAGTRTGAEIEAAWAAAAEQAADDEAAGCDAESRTRLAAALVRVASMTQGPPPAWMAGMVAFYEGADLEQRVKRLLRPGTSHATPPVALAACLLLVGLAILTALTDATSVHLHLMMEAAVRHLP